MASDSDALAAEAGEAAERTGPARWFPRRARLTVVVVAVLVVSTMGGASAAALITGRQIKDGTVTGRDVRDHSLRPKDAQAGIVRPGPQGPQGPVGPTGTTAGAPGAPGRNGLGGLITVVSRDPFSVPANGTAISAITCPDGFSALGGGAAGADQAAVKAMTMTRSTPASSGSLINGWIVGARNSDGADIGVYVWVQCGAI